MIGSRQENISGHYNAQPNRSIKERNKTQNKQIRDTNNAIKGLIFRNNLRNVKTVFDIGIGKGGDLIKYSSMDIEYLYGVDIANVSLLDALDRIRELDLNYRIVLKHFDFFNSLIDLNLKFDVVVSQFAFHYCFMTERRFYTTIKNIDRLMMVGSRLILTIPNKMEILDRKKAGTLKNNYYNIEFKEDWVDSIFGSCYYFSLVDSVDNCIEPLVCEDTLINALKEKNIVLKTNESFDRYISSYKNDKSSRFYMNLSQEEKKVISLYSVLIFEKKL